MSLKHKKRLFRVDVNLPNSSPPCNNISPQQEESPIKLPSPLAITPSQTDENDIDDTACNVVEDEIVQNNKSVLVHANSVTMDDDNKLNQDGDDDIKFNSNNHSNRDGSGSFATISTSEEDGLDLDDFIGENTTDTLANHGYKIIRKMCNTLQGEMYEAEIYDHNKILSAADKDEKEELINIVISPKRHKNNNIQNIKRVVIKKSHKILCDSKLSIQDEMNIVVEENIVKEAILLFHLTVENKPTGDYICEFVNFFESQNEYYLVMKYISDTNLTQFIAECHEYIKNGKLELKDYKRITKYLFWQLVVLVHVCLFDIMFFSL